MTPYRLEYHPDAVQDLLAIHDFIANYAGRVIADRKLAEIEAATYRLGDMPKIGSRREEISPGLRILPAAGKAVICFTIDDESRTVVILCISYAGSDWRSRVEDRS